MAFNIKVGGLEGFPCVGISFTAPLLGNNTIQNLFLHFFFLFVYRRGKGEIIHLHFIISVLSKSLMVYKGSSVAMVKGLLLFTGSNDQIWQHQAWPRIIFFYINKTTYLP